MCQYPFILAVEYTEICREYTEIMFSYILLQMSTYTSNCTKWSFRFTSLWKWWLNRHRGYRSSNSWDVLHCLVMIKIGGDSVKVHFSFYLRKNEQYIINSCINWTLSCSQIFSLPWKFIRRCFSFLLFMKYEIIHLESTQIVNTIIMTILYENPYFF